jgi:hypothetical protein
MPTTTTTSHGRVDGQLERPVQEVKMASSSGVTDGY